MMSQQDWLGLDGRIVVVTGAAGGIGRALLSEFHKAGARIVALTLTDDDAGRTLDELGLSTDTDRAMGLACDVSDASAVAVAAEKVEAQWGACDVLVNNAGILRPGPLLDLDLDDWHKMLQVNLDACLICSQRFGRSMMQLTSGAIVHIASISGSQPQPFSGAYSSGKAALVMLSRQLAYEWGRQGIRSNVVSPGLVKTPLSEKFYADEAIRKAREALVPCQRIGTPLDMANAAVFLASDRAGYINGQEIVVDGGLSQTLMGNVPRPGYG